MGAATTRTKRPLRRFSPSAVPISSTELKFGVVGGPFIDSAPELVRTENTEADRKSPRFFGIGKEHVLFELKKCLSPQPGRVVEELGDHPAHIRIPLFLHLHQTDLATIVNEDQIGGTGGER